MPPNAGKNQIALDFDEVLRRAYPRMIGQKLPERFTLLDDQLCQQGQESGQIK